MSDPRPWLVAEDLAVEYTRRPAATIRRWAAEGRITRYGEGRGNVRYNARELHMYVRDPWTGEITPGETPEMPSEPRGRVAA